MKVVSVYKVGNLLPKGKFILHSTFKNVVNFINVKQQILSFAVAESYLSPNTLIINSLDFSEVKEIFVDKEKIFILNKSFFLEEIKQYNSFFEYKPNVKIDLRHKILSFERDFLHKFNKKSLVFLLNSENEKYFETLFDRAFVKYIKQAYSHIKNGNLYVGIEKIKGAGFGLTPSGDDFIAGMLYAFNVLINTQLANSKYDTKKIRELAHGKNHISNSLIYFASKGAYYKRFKDFQEALLYKENNIEYAFNELIKIGETSSSDMLTGFISTIKNF